MLFSYKGITKEHRYKRGVIEANSSSEAIVKIKESEDVIALIHLKPLGKFQSLNSFRMKLNEKLEVIENKQYEKMKKSLEAKNTKKKDKKKKAKSVSEDSPILKAINKAITKYKKEDLSNEALIARREMENSIVNYNSKDPVIFKEEKIQEPRKRSNEKPKDKEEGSSLDLSLLGAEETQEMKKNRKIKVKEKEMTMFTRRLHIMISSGMSLLNSLITIQESSSKELSQVISRITDDIQKGSSFSEAISKFPRQFNSTYVALVSIGEKSGSLDKSLEDIIRVRDQQAKINNKMKVASMYPIVIGIVLVALMAGAFLFFLPKFEEMYSEQDMEMPMFSQIVFGVAGVFPIIMVILGIMIVALLIARKKIPEVDFAYRKIADKLILKLPVVSKVATASYMYTFSSTISLMLDNGIRLSDTLELTKRTINNIYIKKEIENISLLMVQGQSFSESLEGQEFFDEVLVNIVNTGEKSGQMTYSLQQVSKFYNDELTRQIDSLLELVQPVSILLIAIVLAPIIVAAYLPILEVSSGGLSGFD